MLTELTKSDTPVRTIRRQLEYQEERAEQAAQIREMINREKSDYREAMLMIVVPLMLAIAILAAFLFLDFYSSGALLIDITPKGFP